MRLINLGTSTVQISPILKKQADGGFRHSDLSPVIINLGLQADLSQKLRMDGPLYTIEVLYQYAGGCKGHKTWQLRH